jgi:hypothetical protein
MLAELGLLANLQLIQLHSLTLWWSLVGSVTWMDSWQE